MNVLKGIAWGLLDFLAVAALTLVYGSMVFFAILATIGAWK